MTVALIQKNILKFIELVIFTSNKIYIERKNLFILNPNIQGIILKFKKNVYLKL